MKIFQTLSIRNRLIGIILLVTMFAVGTGFTLVIISEVTTFKNGFVNNIIVHARLIGEYCVTPLTFEDRMGVEEILTKLSTIPSVLNACVYDNEGKLFATYHKPKEAVISFPVVRDMSSELKNNYLHVFQPITYQNKKYGTVYLRACAGLVKRKVKNSLTTMGLLMGGLLILSYFLARKFQKVISEPILNLADVTKKISDAGDYSFRAGYQSRDEIGTLYQGFNNMLDQLQNREIERDVVEKELKVSEERYRQLYDEAPVGYHEIDREGKITRVNQTEADLFGYRIQEMVGKPVWDFVAPDEQELAQKSVMERIGQKVHLEGFERKFVCKDGREIDVYIEERLIVDKKGQVTGIRSTLRNITARKRAEDQIKASLKEKEVLLKEIHHRVKNNLQVISSLLNLQSRYIKDKLALEMFKESQNRVRSMALVHENLYQSHDLAKIDFGSYIKTLANSLYRSYGTDPEKIILEVKIEEVSLGIDLAVPCGLIINELVSNALKHAFPLSREVRGKIEISLLSTNDNKIELVVRDNGIGLSENIDFRRTESLGLHLVVILVEDQLDGRITLDRREGTEFLIKFEGREI